jgi:hypothetical protein
MRQYEALWYRVIQDFKQNSKTIVEEVNSSQAQTTAKAVRKEKLRDELNWKVSFYYELFATYDDETFELTLELRPRRGRTIDGDNLRRML